MTQIELLYEIFKYNGILKNNNDIKIVNFQFLIVNESFIMFLTHRPQTHEAAGNE